MNILRRVFLTIEGYDLIRKEEVVLAAVSGGPDSVALLTLLKEINELQQLGWQIHVGHFNHGLRGRAAAKDEEFVKKLAEDLKLPFVRGSADVKALRKQEGLSLEEAARKSRYAWLREAALSVNAKKIALGHNLDDQAETILHRVIRGTGLRGLKGMAPIRRLSKKHDLYVVRPLLEVERFEIESFLKDRSMKFRTDATNADVSLTRNRLRHKLIPDIEREFNPRVKSALVKLGQTAGSFYLLVREIADEVYENTKMLGGEDEVCLNVEEFAKLPPAIQTLIIDKSVRTVLGALPHLNFEHYLEIISLCGEQGYAKAIRLPKGLEARRESYVLKIYKPKKAPPPLHFRGQKLSVPGSTVIPKLNIRIEAEVLEGKIIGLKDYIRNKDYTEEILDLDKIQGPLQVRVRKTGDTFNPLGARGRTKLKKFFIDAKVPKTMRDRVPLVSDKDRILWVVGYRLANDVRITDDTKKVLKLKVSRVTEGGERMITMEYAAERERMVKDQLERKGIRNRRVLDAFRSVPRHLFVNPADEAAAYQDRPLALSGGQTISQPYMVALMTESLDVAPGHRALEVGTGSGYQAAILAELGAIVHTVERLPALSDEARRRLERTGYHDIRYRVGDGTLGWPEEPAFDRIVVTAGAPDVPIGLLTRLGEGGVLVVPIGDDRVQELVRFRRGDGRVSRERLCRCSFVKLIGAEGWPEN